ncbi:hypothetical protein [Lysobacter sp. HA18]
MKSIVSAAFAAALLLCAFDCAASERWYWATAQCSDESEENVYMFAAVVSVDADDDDADAPQHSQDSARFGFGNHAESTYADDYCAAGGISAQNMAARGSYDSRDEAAAALDAYVESKEADDSPWLTIVRVDDYTAD